MAGIRFIIKVRGTGHAYIPEEVRRAGYVGELDGLPNNYTFVLIKPGSTSEEVIASLREHIRHLQMGSSK